MPILTFSQNVRVDEDAGEEEEAEEEEEEEADSLGGGSAPYDKHTVFRNTRGEKRTYQMFSAKCTASI